MNVNNIRNEEKEKSYGVFRFYDIYNMEKGGLGNQTYIGSVVMRHDTNKAWWIVRPEEDVEQELEREPFGDFMQCIAELKIQKELAE